MRVLALFKIFTLSSLARVAADGTGSISLSSEAMASSLSDDRICEYCIVGVPISLLAPDVEAPLVLAGKDWILSIQDSEIHRMLRCC